MINKKIAALLFLFILSSCTDAEKRLASLVKDIEENAQQVELIDNSSIDEVSSLEKMKQYTDSMDGLLTVLEKIIQKKSVRSRARKYLIERGELSNMCSKYFLAKGTYRNFEKKCTLAYFNICPATFAKYPANKNNTIGQLKKILGEEHFTKTDCKSFTDEGEK